MSHTALKPVTRYHLRVELDDISPMIWRRFWITNDRSLYELHRTIQAVMGWSDAHLHEIHIGGVLYAEPDPEEELRAVVDERRVTLQKALHGISRFVYVYDLGDDWRHTVAVESVEQAAGDAVYARIEGGARACPPEDSGGAHRYQEFVDQLARRPQDAEVRDFLTWAGPNFDPERFELSAVASALSRKAWNRAKRR